MCPHSVHSMNIKTINNWRQSWSFHKIYTHKCKPLYGIHVYTSHTWVSIVFQIIRRGALILEERYLFFPCFFFLQLYAIIIQGGAYMWCSSGCGSRCGYVLCGVGGRGMGWTLLMWSTGLHCFCISQDDPLTASHVYWGNESYSYGESGCLR